MRKPIILPNVLWLTLLSLPAWGQLTVLPTEGKYLGFVSAPEAGKWIVISAGEFLPVPCTPVDGGKAIIFEAASGKYGIFYFPPGDAQPVVQVLTLGKGVVPPGPDPPVPPGVRKAVILEESSARTPAQALLYAQLLRELPGTLILDNDLPQAKKYLPLSKLSARPVLLVLTDKDLLVREVSVPSSVAAVKQELDR